MLLSGKGTMVQNREKHGKQAIHCPTSEGVSEVSAAECASEARRAVRANERTEERVAHYFSLDSDYSGP